MSSPEVIYAWRWLIRDTFRQSRANYVFWVMLAASALVIFFCLSVSIEGGEPLRPADDLEVRPAHGQMSLAFGAWRIQLFRDGQAQVHFMLLLLAEWVAGAGGTLLALVWTAGFMPEFLQPANATVLAFQANAALGLAHGQVSGRIGLRRLSGHRLHRRHLARAADCARGSGSIAICGAFRLLLLHFAAVYSFSVFLAVCTRSILVCVFGSVAFWFLCWGMNYGRHCLAGPGIRTCRRCTRLFVGWPKRVTGFCPSPWTWA